MENGTLFVSFRRTRSKTPGFLDDYANTILALISLYEATLEKDYLNKALQLTEKTADNFFDRENGGFPLWCRCGTIDFEAERNLRRGHALGQLCYGI